MARMTRRTFTTGLVAAPSIARAQAPSASPITIVVPFAPGGSTDVLARLLQAPMQQALGSSVVIENKPGATGTIGSERVMRAKPDGQTFLLTFDSHAVNPAMLKLPYDTETDFDPVLLVATSPYLLACLPNRGFKTLADCIAAAKAAPGKINYGTVGAGTIGHLAMTLLGKRAGAEFNLVAYKGGSPAMNDMLGGHLDLLIGSTALISPQIEAGKLVALTQMSKTRIASLPHVPTAIEAGFEGFEATAWWGFFAPKGTPPDLIERFRAAAVGAARDAKVSKQLTEQQQMVLALAGPAELKAFLAQEIRRWGDVVRDNKITIDQ